VAAAGAAGAVAADGEAVEAVAEAAAGAADGEAVEAAAGAAAGLDVLAAAACRGADAPFVERAAIVSKIGGVEAAPCNGGAA
jgi:hypothetical protein